MTSPQGEQKEQETQDQRQDYEDGHGDQVQRESEMPSTEAEGGDRVEREDPSYRQNVDRDHAEDERLEKDYGTERQRHHDEPERTASREDHEQQSLEGNGKAPNPSSPSVQADDPPRETDYPDAAPNVPEERMDGERLDTEAEAGEAPGADQSNLDLVNLFVRNVAKHVMEEQLVELFSKYGKVDSAVVVRDPHSRECRGFGFVKMLEEEEAANAIEGLRDFEFEGRRISVEKARRKAPHSRTPGEYMGIDRRIRDRYAGMKRSREYDGGYGYSDYYGMGRRDGYRGRRYEDDGRHRYDDRGWDPRSYRAPQVRPPYDDRERKRGRYGEDPNSERDNRFREREPPVPREPADDYV